MNRRSLALAAGTLMLAAPGAQARTITDFLDRIGGCRKPMSESFSYEISPYTPKPYGKALGEWTDQDVADFRAYFVACQTRRPDWRSMGDYNRNDEIRVIDTAMAELHYKVGAARDAARAQRTVDDSRIKDGILEQAKQLARGKRHAGLEEQIQAVTQEQAAFIEQGMEGLAPEEKVARLDGLIAKMQVIGSQAAELPRAQALWQTRQATIGQRDEVIREVRREAARRPPPPIVNKPEIGPYASVTLLAIDAMTAAMNPLRQEEFRVSIRRRGIDLTARVGGIEPSGNDWLVQLVDRPGTRGREGQGFFCRVPATDTASLAVLRTVTPTISGVHIVASDTAELLMLNSPVRLRVVFSPCQISPPDDSFNSLEADASDTQPLDLPTSTPPKRAQGQATNEPRPVAPSPPDLRCLTEVSRQRGQWTVAHRLRRVWQIPEALRADPSLVVTVALTKDHKTLTEPPIVTRSESKQATPDEMQAAVEAAHRAIQEAAPFPELGPSSLGPIKIDMTPCD